MANHDYVIANGTGAAVRADLNNALAAIVSNNSSSSEPSTKYAYQWWADTTTGQLKLRNAANNGWVTIFELDGTMLMEDGTVSAPGLAFASDLNTGFFSGGADKLNFATGGVERLEIGSSEVVFNDGSNDVDFRVESNGQTHMLFVDGGNDAIGIGTSSPSSFDSEANNLVVGNGVGDNGITIFGGSSAGDHGSIFFADSSSGGAAKRGQIRYEQNNEVMSFHTAETERCRVDLSGRLLVGSTSAYVSDANFQVTDDTNAKFVISNPGNATYSLAVGTDNALAFKDESNATERMRLDISGRLLAGLTSSSKNARIVAQGNSDNAASSAEVYLQRGTATPPDGTDLATIHFADNTGAAGVDIRGQRDGGTWSGSSKPGRLVFSTTADGASSPTERVRLTSSGRLGVNTSSPETFLHVDSSNTAKSIVLSRNGGVSGRRPFGIGIAGGTDATLRISCSSDTSGANAFDNQLIDIENSGTVLIGQTTGSFGATGHILSYQGQAFHVVSGDTPLLLNRQGNDGEIVRIAQGNVTEGNITVSGSTVSYNGAHLSRWSQLAAGAARTEILRGSVLSNLDEMCEWGEEDNEQLNRMKVSDTEGDKNVSGVFQTWDDDDDTYTNDFYCAMTGDFVIRIAQGTTVARGDLLMSAGDGTAKPQDDDIVRSKTIAKVTSTTVSETYADNSYCVPCVLMAC